MSRERHEERDKPRNPFEVGPGAVWVGVAIAAAFLVSRLTPFQPLQDALGWYRQLTEALLAASEWVFREYGYLATFLAPLVENSFLLGLLIPGAVIMVVAGLGAHDGLINPFIATPLGIAGAIIGDVLSYVIGRYGWKRMLRGGRFDAWTERMREPLMESATSLVLMYHFFGYTRLIGPTAAGFMRMPFRKWAPLDFIGASLWVITFMGGGYLLGVLGLTLDDTERNVRVFEWLLFVAFVLWWLLTVQRSIDRAARRQRARAERAPEVAAVDERP
ncbi:MAG TPA: VTT domain-containing protein [Dehalococcoidia bacterium]|nr:VTT domain-containing protein [Dehalococcoidia bacterium]